jgi:mannose-1-phosphate guanylyltransferase
MQGAPRPGADRRIAYENEVLFLNIAFEAGYKATPHKHTWPALYYITGGSGRALVADEWREVGPGMLVMIPAGSMHSIEATTRLTLIEVQSGCPQQFVDGLLGQ